MAWSQVDNAWKSELLTKHQTAKITIVGDDDALQTGGDSKNSEVTLAAQTNILYSLHIQLPTSQPLHDRWVNVFIGQERILQRIHAASSPTSTRSLRTAAAA